MELAELPIGGMLSGVPMEPRILLFVIFGIAIAGEVWLERRLEGTWLSLPIVYVMLGWGLFSLPLQLGWLDPVFDSGQTAAVEYLTEMIVIVSLVGVGLSVDRLFTWRNWKPVIPLLLVTMPLCIAGVAGLGWWWLGLTPAAAILLGACLAPTDPVLARAVQVGPPGDNERNDVKFKLSVEAGLNDSLAFPFVYLAMALSTADPPNQIGQWMWSWVAVDVVWKILAGVGIGLLIGKGAAWLVFRKSGGKELELAKGHEGMIVISVLLLSYGVGELVNGYGFLSVFVAAVTAKQYELKSELHGATHRFIDQVERITLVVILIGFGGLLASGILRDLTWSAVGLVMVFLLVLRPLSGMVALLFSGLPWKGRFAVGFLGVRGIGSLYYLAYGQRQGDFDQISELWSAIAFAILASIVLHGVTAAKLLGSLDRVEHSTGRPLQGEA